MMQERRERKDENLKKIHEFVKGVKLMVQSKQDDEWHPAQLLKMEGKMLRV